MRKNLKIKNLLYLSMFGLSVGSFSLTSCQGGMSDYATTDSSGLDYMIVKDKSGENAKPDDFLKISIVTTVHDSTLMDSYKQTPNYQWLKLQKPSGQKYDLMEGLALLSAGDSAIFRIPADSVMNGFNRPPFVKDGDMIYVHVMVHDVKTPEGYEKMVAEEAENQNKEDAKIIKQYVDSLGASPLVTDDGVNVIVTQEGDGPKAQDGQNVSILYTGKLLNGTKFDSNMDSAFHHTDPLDFALGRGMMIKGMESGIKLLGKNAKATLIIPSSLAYGESGRPPVIQPNSVLLFDVDVLDITGDPAPKTSQGGK